ncbi:MAG: hypothetical protein AAFY88_20930, partial [Acidobacteriota bacterium]
MMPAEAWAVVAVVAVALAVDLTARRRDPSGDSGGVWAQALGGFGVLIFPALLASAWLETLSPGLWSRGVHLHADRTGVWGFAPADVYPWALWGPLLLWLALLLTLLLRRPGRSAARWIAGSAGFGDSRAWLAPV